MGIHPNAKNRIVINKGDKFGRLTFIEEIRIGNRRTGRCICECGKIVDTRLFNLTSGNSNSCGCYGREKLSESITTHGLSKHRLFSTYNGINDRCNNIKNKDYKNYGGRGIKCEWKTFEDFLNDMEYSWKEGLSIDRKDNDGNYSKDNCRWATMKDQNRNRRSNIMVGDICLMDYCTEHNLKYVTITSRIRKGWSIEDAINKPIKTDSRSYTITQ